MNSSKKDLESFIISWNSKFKYDRLWRIKYKIPFGSPQHLQVSQIDIYLDLLEDRLFDKAQAAHIQRIKDLEEYENTGNFLREEKMSQEEEDKLYKKIKLR